MGQIVRAAGSGLRVLVFQFLKDNSSSERVILEQIPNITCLPGREKIKFFNQMNGEEQRVRCGYAERDGIQADAVLNQEVTKPYALRIFQGGFIW